MTDIASPLDRDTSLRFPSLVVLSASAGSGKTYTLTLRFVQFLLSSAIPHHGVTSLLAVTFTNNAAREMRVKILEWLRKAALGDRETLATLGSVIALDHTTIQKRAEALVGTILDGYSDFHVRTIDSFMTMIFRSGALGLGFSPDTTIALESAPLFDRAFDLLGREIWAKSTAAAVMSDIIGLLQPPGRSRTTYLWDPYDDIRREVKKLSGLLASLVHPPRRERSDDRIASLTTEILRQAEEVASLCEASGLEMTKHFAGDLALIRSRQFDELMERAPRTSIVKKGTAAAAREAYKAWEPVLSAALIPFNDLMAEYTSARSTGYYQPYLSAAAMLHDALARVRRERGVILLDDINALLHEQVQRGWMPDILFALGETIWHYMIDEFQDTSPVQWENLKPLLGNALASDGSLFVVGDTRQSIYGFRGADWQIMARIGSETVFPPAPPDARALTTNFRSREAILQFTREVFEQVIPGTEYGEAARQSGLTSLGQEVHEQLRGSGHVEVTPFTQNDRSSERDRILAIIRDCVERGYRPGDIAILTPFNGQVVTVSGWLNDAGIPFLSHSNLDIRKRGVAQEIISLLTFLDTPIDNLAFCTVMLGGLAQTHWQESGYTRADFLAFVTTSHQEGGGTRRPLYRVFGELYPEIWKKLFHDLYARVGHLPLYDLVTDIYRVFDVFRVCPGEEATFVKMLEVVREFSEQGSNSVRDFLGYAGGAEGSWEIRIPPHADAVTVMTVHKAKGLGFPVVIALLYDRKDHGNRYIVHETSDDVLLLKITENMARRVPWLKERRESHERMRRTEELNQLYVALTRAQEELYVIPVDEGEPGFPSMFLPQEGYNVRSKPTVNRPPAPASPSVRCEHIRPGATPEIRPGFQGSEETGRGERIHAVLAAMEFIGDDAETEIGTIVHQVSRATSDAKDLGGIITRFLADEVAGRFFVNRPGRRVLREQDLCDANGRIYRADRIVIDPGSITVIDFKTGGSGREHEYEQQVRTYMSLLGRIHPGVPVSGAIAWVDLRLVTEIA